MTLLVEGAADWELQPLIAALENRVEERRAIWTFWRGGIGPAEVVVARTDWGPINAVAATVTAIEAYRPAAIISQGMAGAHDPALAVGDIVVGERTVDVSAYKSDPAAVGSGIAMSRRVPLEHRFRVDGAEGLASFRSFPGDGELVAAALAARNPRGRVVRGTVGSAYQYNRELDAITELRRLYSTDCEDMESAFEAGAAVAFGVPFVSIRMISNSEWRQPALDKTAGEDCARFVVEMIREGRVKIG